MQKHDDEPMMSLGLGIGEVPRPAETEDPRNLLKEISKQPVPNQLQRPVIEALHMSEAEASAESSVFGG